MDNRAANSTIHSYSPRSPPAICTLTPQGCYDVRVSGVAATVCAAASPAVFPLATVCPEWLPVIALAVVKHVRHNRKKAAHKTMILQTC
jgi:hypothetical protein